jgi:hypothetical protein
MVVKTTEQLRAELITAAIQEIYRVTDIPRIADAELTLRFGVDHPLSANMRVHHYVNESEHIGDG